MFLSRRVLASVFQEVGEFSRTNSMDTEDEIKMDTISQESYEPIFTYEGAMLRTNFGWFNMQIILGYLTVVVLYLVQVSGMSYIAPILGCDVIANDLQKAALISSGYLGVSLALMVLSSLSYNYRRKYFIIGSAILFTCLKLTSACYQNFLMLWGTEVAAGFLAGMCFFVYSNEMLEYHYGIYRRRFLMICLIMMSFAQILILIGVWGLFNDSDRTLHTFENGFEVRITNLYLVICSFPGVVVAATRAFFAETPKYYINVEDEGKALDLIKSIRKINTGESEWKVQIFESTYFYNKDNFVDESWWVRHCIFLRMLGSGGNLAFFCAQNALVMGTLHALRMWMPTVLAEMNTRYVNNSHVYTSKCSTVGDNSTIIADCIDQVEIGGVYFKMIIAMTTASIANILFHISWFNGHRKVMMNTFTLLSTLFGITMVFALDARAVVILAGILFSLLVMVQITTFEVVMNIYILYNPSLTMYFVMACGSIGAVIGAFAFELADYYCYGSISFISACSGVLFMMSFFVPKEGYASNATTYL